MDPAELREAAAEAAEAGDWTTALLGWKQIGETEGIDAQVTRETARALAELARPKEAERIIAAGLKEFENDLPLLLDYATLAETEMDFPTAAERWQAVLAAAPTDETAWSRLIFSHMRSGDRRSARIALKRARSTLPDDAGLLAEPHIRQLMKR